MVQGAIEFFGVEWIGDNQPALEQVGPIFGSLLVAVVAAFAAWLAAHTARKRQQKQLDHDSERQQEQLNHDSERQEDLLRHDREMRDRDLLRQTVTAALENAISTTSAISGLAVKVEIAEQREVAVRAFDDEDETEERVAALEASVEALQAVNDNIAPAHEARVKAMTDTVRLRALLGEKHQIVRTHKKLAQAYDAWYGTLQVDGSIKSQKQKEVDEGVGGEVAPALRGFEGACRDEFSA